MTDGEYREQLKRIARLAQPWIDCLGLNWWHLNFEYARDLAEFQTPDHPDVGQSTVAYTCVNFEYLDARIVFNVSALPYLEDHRLEEIILHEFMHVLLAETRYGTTCDCPFDIKREERVATQLARAFLWTRTSVEKRTRRKVLSPSSLERKASQ